MKDFYRHYQLLFAVTVCVFFGQQTLLAQGKYKAGDRVQCNTVGSLKYENAWENGTVMAFRPNDGPDGSWYRVKADVNQVEYFCRVEHIRPARGGGQTAGGNNGGNAGGMGGTIRKGPPQTGNGGRGGGTNAMPDPGSLLDCPVDQPKVRNGAAPNVELFKKIIRCHKGEKAVDAGDEGAVKVDISAITIGASRLWTITQDEGSGKIGVTRVYPVKATYNITTFYRTATEVETGWVRILNFYVNAVGEWDIGSEESIKAGKANRIQR